MMPAITVRNISVEAHKALKQRAKVRGTSAEAEVRAMLEGIVAAKPTMGLGTILQEFGRKYGPLPTIKRDKTPLEPADFG